MASRFPSRLWISVHLLWRWLPTLGRRAPVARPARVLVAHHLLLGDTLMLAPLLAKLRRNLPEAEIIMATPRAIAPLYAHRPYGVEAIAYDPSDVATLCALDRRRNFDLALIPADNRYSWLAAALGARWIVAFAGDRPPYKSWPVDERVLYRDTPTAWGDLATDLIEGEPPAPYEPGQWPAPPARAFERPAGAYAVLHIGASTPLKLWSPGNWQILARECEARGLEVVLSAGPREQPYVDAIDPAQRWRAYAGTLDLPQLWQLLAGARVLICPDTGVAHLGRIAGTPTITLFGPGSQVLSGAGEFWGGSRYWPVTVDPFPCRNQQLVFKRSLPWVRRCYRSPRECSDNRCMKAISPAMVTSALEQALACA